MRKLWNTCVIWLFLSLFSLLTAPLAHTQGTCVCFERQFVRATGPPVVETYQFDVPFSDQYTMTVINGSLEDSDLQRVSSSVISVNGTQVLGPSNFNQNVSQLTVPLNLNSGTNTIAVELRGKSGGTLNITITSNNGYSGVVGPEGGIIEVSDFSNPLYGTKIEFPSGCLTDETVITISYVSKNDVEQSIEEDFATRGINYLTGFEIGPPDITFEIPVKLYLPNQFGLSEGDAVYVAQLVPNILGSGGQPDLVLKEVAYADGGSIVTASEFFAGINTPGIFAAVTPTSDVGWLQGTVFNALGSPVKGAIVDGLGGLMLTESDSLGRFTLVWKHPSNDFQGVGVIASTPDKHFGMFGDRFIVLPYPETNHKIIIIAGQNEQEIRLTLCDVFCALLQDDAIQYLLDFADKFTSFLNGIPELKQLSLVFDPSSAQLGICGRQGFSANLSQAFTLFEENELPFHFGYKLLNKYTISMTLGKMKFVNLTYLLGTTAPGTFCILDGSDPVIAKEFIITPEEPIINVEVCATGVGSGLLEVIATKPNIVCEVNVGVENEVCPCSGSALNLSVNCKPEALVMEPAIVTVDTGSLDMDHFSAEYEDSNQDWDGDGTLDGTDRNGDLPGDKILAWHSNVIHSVCTNFHVPPDYTLIVEPGVVVKLGSGARIDCTGVLVADDATFTSAEGSPNLGDWDRIVVKDPRSRLDNCIFEYGGMGSNGCEVEIIGLDGEFNITNCKFRYSAATGLQANLAPSVTLNLSQCEFTKNATCGAEVYNGAQVNITGSKFLNNVTGLWLLRQRDFLVDSCIFDSSYTALEVHEQASGTIKNNGIYGYAGPILHNAGVVVFDSNHVNTLMLGLNCGAVTSAEITNNVISTQGAGMALYPGTGSVTAKGNSVCNCGGTGIDIYDGFVTLDQNVICNNYADGIATSGGSIHIKGNTITGNGECGIDSARGGTVIAGGNTISDNGWRIPEQYCQGWSGCYECSNPF